MPNRFRFIPVAEALSRVVPNSNRRIILSNRHGQVDAHILVAFLAYCLTVTLRHRLRMHAPGFDTAGSPGKTGGHSNAGRIFSDYRWPPTGNAALHRTESRAGPLLHHLTLVLPQQPPPRITAPASTDPVLTSKCSGDLRSPFVENNAHSRIRSAQLRRFG